MISEILLHVHLTQNSTYRHKQLHRHMLVTGFGYLLVIIKLKTCDSTVTRTHTNVRLLTRINTSGNYMWEGSHPLRRDCMTV